LAQCTPEGGAKCDAGAFAGAIVVELLVIAAGVYVSALNAISNMKNSGAIFIALEFIYETTPFPVLAVIPSRTTVDKGFYKVETISRFAGSAIVISARDAQPFFVSDTPITLTGTGDSHGVFNRACCL
jgi:hypothetical protein